MRDLAVESAFCYARERRTLDWRQGVSSPRFPLERFIWNAELSSKRPWPALPGSGLTSEPASAAAPTLASETLPTTGAPQTAAGAAAALPRVADAGELRGEMIYRKLGTTGETVSAIGLGGSHIGKPALTEADSIKLIHEALDRGITFLDNSWDYNEGQSELRMGKALAEGGYRQKAFLMTKLDGRTKEAAANQLEDSLRRLKTDHIDLVQFHEILRFDDPDRVFAEDGALEAVMAAKKAGKLRYIGFTGHKDPRIHLYMLEVASKHGFHFDTVQMPINVMDAHYRSFGQLVAPPAVEQGIGISGHEVPRRYRDPEERNRYGGGVPQLLAEPAGVGADHGDRRPPLDGSGVRRGEGLQADDRRRYDGAARQDRSGRGAWQIRALQDDGLLRHHGQAPGFSGGSNHAGAGPGALGERVVRPRKHSPTESQQQRRMLRVGRFDGLPQRLGSQENELCRS